MNEHLGRFDIVATVPLKCRAQSGLDLRLMCIKAVEGVLVFLLIDFTKYNLCPRCIIVCYAMQIKTADTEEAIDPVIPRRINIGKGAILAVCLLDNRKRVCPVFSPEFITTAQLIGIGFILITEVKYQVCRIFIVQFKETTQDKQLALCAGISPHIDAITDFQ